MAEAVSRIGTRIVTEEIPVIDLTLTIDEALTLLVICRNIGGDHAKSRRKHTNSIDQTLLETGLFNLDSEVYRRVRRAMDNESFISFKNEEGI